MANKLGSLPKWAQKEIERLRADLAHTKEQLAAVQLKSTKFPRAVSGVLEEDRIGCADNHVQFEFGRGIADVITVSLGKDPGQIKIHGMTPLVVRPSAANAVEISLESF